MTTAPIWEPPAETGTPPPQPPKRHRGRTALIVVGGVLGAFVLLIGLGLALANPRPSGTPAAHPSTSTSFYQPSVAAPAPTASPDGTYTGSCDVSLSSDLYGQDYLTADVTVSNTGNVGTYVRTRASWGQQGFEPIHMSRTVKVAAGGERVVHFHYPATTDQISRFQDVQLASTGDGCHYHSTITGTFGAVQGG